MGQYYMPVVGNEKGSYTKVYDRSVDGEYMCAKLLEHSWFGNLTMQNVAKLLHNKPQRLMWCGDYAENEDFKGDFKSLRNIPEETKIPKVGRIWGNRKTFGFEGIGIGLDGKFFVNHEQKLFVDLDEFFIKSKDKDGWCLCPISLLTAVGNNRGGGDYYDCNINFNQIGSWAWNLVEVADKAPEGYSKLDVVFKDGR